MLSFRFDNSAFSNRANLNLAMDQVSSLFLFLKFIFTIFNFFALIGDVCVYLSMKKLRRLVKEPMVWFTRLVTVSLIRL